MYTLQILSAPFDFEEQYFSWRRVVYQEYIKFIQRSVKNVDKTFLEIRKDINRAVRGGILNPPKKHCVPNEEEGIEFFKNYVDAWFEHDNYLLGLTKNRNMDHNHSIKDILSNLIENDARIMTYTLNLQDRIGRLSNNDNKLEEAIISLPVHPFEFDLINLIDSKGKDYAFEAFPLSEESSPKEDVYQFEPYSEDLDKRITSVKLCRFINQNKDPKCLLNKLRLGFRMVHWEVYEEQRKRFLIEFGLIDYILREKIFLRNKDKSGLEFKSGVEVPPILLIEWEK